MPEALALDPVEFAPERVELFIPGENDLGAPFYLKADGLDYGESSAQLEMVRRAIGEGATDRRWPNIECTIPLIIRGDRSIPLATAINELESKVGLFQRKGENWIRRDFDLGGGFAGSVGCPVHTAAITGLQGWMMANKQVLPDVTLKLLRHPFWYSTVEIEAAEVSASEARDLQFTIAEVLGTAPGLIRIRFKNENQEADLRGLICALESWDYSPGATAALAYEAESLTPTGGAKVVEGVGASGGKVVQHLSLTAGWLTILDSEIAGVGHMTHVGVRRMKFRVFQPDLGQVQLKLEWRPLGATSWSEDSGVVTAPVVNGWAIVDLGECRPERAVAGNQRWEWRLVARAPGGAGAIIIDRVWILPVEQFLEVSTPGSSHVPDQQAVKGPGTVVEASGVGTGPWEKTSNAKASDNTYAESTLGDAQVSHYLKATNFAFGLPEGATVLGIVATIERSSTKNVSGYTARDKQVRIVKAGVIKEAVDKVLPWEWPTSDASQSYGGSNDLWGQTWTPSDINDSGFGIALAAVGGFDGTSTAKVDAFTITVYFTEAQDESKVCFAKRSVEMRTDRVERQHPTDDVWGPLIPEGFLPYAPPSGLEWRPLRGIVIPTQGDLAELADAGSNSGSVTALVRPAYLFAREAA